MARNGTNASAIAARLNSVDAVAMKYALKRNVHAFHLNDAMINADPTADLDAVIVAVETAVVRKSQPGVHSNGNDDSETNGTKNGTYMTFVESSPAATISVLSVVIISIAVAQPEFHSI